MKKSSEMYVNDSKGYENEAKETFAKLLEIFSTTPEWSQERLAGILGINATTLRKYRNEGTVSLYTSKRLSELLEMERDYFNGKKFLSEDIQEEIKRKLILLNKQQSAIRLRSENEKEFDTKKFIDSLKRNVESANSYDEYSLEELEEIESLMKNNLLMVTGRIQIIRVVEGSKKE